jgi:malate dehydrogenase (oxaloacetate-decarboxylating)
MVVEKVAAIPKLKIVDVSDRTFMLHKGGKIEVTSRISLDNRDALAMVYTPGVARVSQAIQADRENAYSLTMKGRTVAIVTDGTAVLGLGDIGPEAALPVMEGKAMLFKKFGNVDAFPVCLATKKVDEIAAIVKAIAPGFGGINLEDISAPRCFEIEDRLIRELDMPVFHDDQHGTAVVVLAALINALKIVGKDLRTIRVVVNGIGAAGVATTRLLMECGCRHIIGCDTAGAIYAGRTENMNPAKEWFAQHTNPRRLSGSLKQVLKGSDFFIGVSGPNLLKRRDIRTMARDPIVFALANPTPEILPEEAGRYARIMATGRSDYPNQINNVLCFPGLFRGALDCGATKITLKMKLAAARAIAGLVPSAEMNEEYIIPSVFNDLVAPAVSAAVARAAREEGVIRAHGRLRNLDS